MIEQIATLKNSTNSKVWSVDWHPKQNLLASVGEDRNITLWKSNNKGEWQKTQSIMTQHLKTIRCVRFSNKGEKIAVCSFDSMISIYILNESSYQFLTQLQGHQNQVKSIDWHESDRKLASCSRDKNIWIWGFNSTTYEYECENILQGHTNDVKCVKWLDYSTLASCSYDDTIRIWTQNDDDYEQSQVLTGHQSTVWCLDFQHNMLISSSSDLTVLLFKRDQVSLKFQLLTRITHLHQQAIYGVIMLYPYVITCSGDNSIVLAREGKQGKQGKQDKQGKQGKQDKQGKQGKQDKQEQQGKQDKQEQQGKQGKQGKQWTQISRVFHGNDVNCIRVVKRELGMAMASCADDGLVKVWAVKI